MNHDYTHCLDEDENCPKTCFRKILNDDLKRGDNRGYVISWANLKNSKECERED